MPKQSRPVVRDGRLQPAKKRTDRSYLGGPEAPGTVPAAAEPEVQPDAVEETAATVAAEATAEESVAAAPQAPAPAPVTTPQPPAPVAAPAATAAVAPTAPRGAARALQQQGVQKRRGVDLEAMARRDTSYAIHELRRIGTLTVMVVVTLIVLGIVMR